MKMYPREYELVFSGDAITRKKCDLNQVSTLNNIPSSVDEYVDLFKEITRDFDAKLFDFLVKYKWLVNRFSYKGVHRAKPSTNGIQLDMAMGVFNRNHVGFDSRFYLNGVAPWGKIITYFPDIFPFFNEDNPFEVPYAFPYKNNTLSHMLYVYQMDERLELLAESERRGMSYSEFLDYVLNYSLCYNDEHGEKYLFIFSAGFQPYIKNVSKKGSSRESTFNSKFGLKRPVRKTRYPKYE